MAKERFLRRMMKMLRKEKKVVISILILVTGMTSFTLQAQDPLKSRLKLEFFNKSGIRSLSSRITARIDDKTTPLPQLRISFYALSDTAKELLGEVLTNDEGRASAEIPCGKEFKKDKEGKTHYLASFGGTKEYLPAESEISIRDILMEMTFYQKDSTKLIRIQAREIGPKGDTLPVEGQKLTFYIPRTFSNLKIGEGPVKGGLAELDFPVTLPGDSTGMLPVLARFEDNEDYGNAEVTASINWGKPLPPAIYTHRGLGDVDAPLWMVYTLIILLSLVWFHYMYAVITVFRIRYLGKKAETEATLSNPTNP